MSMSTSTILTGVLKKNTPQKKKTLGKISLKKKNTPPKKKTLGRKTNKSGAGEQFLLLDCRAETA